jgi:hypothetical protein
MSDNTARGSGTTAAEKIGYLTASVESMGKKLTEIDEVIRDFIRETREIRAQDMHQNRKDYEYLDGKVDRAGQRVAELEGRVQEHLVEHSTMEQARKGSPFGRFFSVFLESLYKAVAMLVIGGLAWVAWQYLRHLAVKGGP